MVKIQKKRSPLGQFIEERMHEVGIKRVAELARICGIDNSALYVMMSKEMAMQMKTAVRLGKALQCSPHEVRKHAKKMPGHKQKKCGYYDNQSMCFKCANAVPTRRTGCPWSKYGEEVEGWRVVVDKKRDGINSVWVQKCPLFNPDKDAPPMDPYELPDKAVYDLAQAITKKTAEDYFAVCKIEGENLRKFNNKLRTLSKFCGGPIDPDNHFWRKKRPEYYAKWMVKKDEPAPKPDSMVDCEVFFTSQYAQIISQADPVYIMNRIRKQVGLPKFEDFRR